MRTSDIEDLLETDGEEAIAHEGSYPGITLTVLPEITVLYL